ncbi:type I polyketide synthase [Synechococcus sp. PCC 7336]|uniref:type I polyketide synthase n=1 Tax=Synechococcus sp. PCC 7336 TaxID=195250 RepID=UPI000349A2F1|nr:type I polyketide synthase [Synechococcus sp. PCC 7336]
MHNSTAIAPDGIAIVGMAGRFPGAPTLEQFWQNLRDGAECVTFFSDRELLDAGLGPDLLANPNYVKARAILDNIDGFDANFFDFTPREAAIADPQHRLFLECAWEALERAGCDPNTFPGRIGLFAGVSTSSYALNNLYLNPNFIQSAGSIQDGVRLAGLGSEKDFLTTRVSYKLNLRGPSVDVQTACSTSLVAIHLACQSLLSYQSDVVLAGGASIQVPHKAGYLHQDGGVLSPDGHCRVFDARARGTVPGSGVGVVVLKRLEEALKEGNRVLAVIRASAMNNDGAVKVGFTAPSVDGQAEAIAEALSLAEVSPETIGYVETHGTGTALGDPIEVAALTQAFRTGTPRTGCCALGSVKASIGHLDAAAGVAGLIKAVLALQHQQIPASLNFEQPNPQINFANSPFFVADRLSAWSRQDSPRRAGVSSFGIGGTNVHAVLEEAPEREPSGPSRPWQLLLLSAQTSTALHKASQNLSQHLAENPSLPLADVAYTLQVGRRDWNHRRVLLCQTSAEAIASFEQPTPQRDWEDVCERDTPSIAFLFPGQGSQYVNMGRQLYEQEVGFQEPFDRCCDLLEPLLGFDLTTLLFSAREAEVADAEKLQQTAIVQPALFAIEYALAQLWMSWGIQPQALLGHSIGEYVAACLAGVWSLEDALQLVAARGRLMQQQPAGTMLAIPLPEDKVLSILPEALELAAINAPNACVVAGAAQAIEAFAQSLQQQGIAARRLHTSHAFHTTAVAEAVPALVELVSAIKLHPPSIPFLSNLTGTWILPEEATNPTYWGQQLRQTVRFADGVAQLLAEGDRVLLEVGPGRTLSTLARQQAKAQTRLLASMRHPASEGSDDLECLLAALAQLWLAGASVDWPAFYAREHRHCVLLPTYPFERQRHWIDVGDRITAQTASDVVQTDVASASTPTPASLKRADIAEWFYLPVWKRSIPPLEPASTSESDCWLIFVDGIGFARQLQQRIAATGSPVMTVSVGQAFAIANDETDALSFVVNPSQKADYEALVAALKERQLTPNKVLHAWGVTAIEAVTSELEAFTQEQENGFIGLSLLLQVLVPAAGDRSLEVSVVANGSQKVSGDESLMPAKATAIGLCRVMGQEYAQVKARHVDIVCPPRDSRQMDNLVNALLAELAISPAEPAIAYRGSHRWVPTFEPVRIEPVESPRLRQGGTYLLIGGLGKVGLHLAEHLAQTVQANLVFVGRSAFPPQAEWSQWLQERDEDDPTSSKIRQLQACQQMGAAVLVVPADVTDREQMAAAIAAANEQLGPIHGAIHAAQSSQKFSIQALEAESALAALAPKAMGALLLDSLLPKDDLDFLLLFSSHASYLGGWELANYTAANAVLNTLASDRSTGGKCLVQAVNWDIWNLEGTQVEALASAGSVLERLQAGMTATEGLDAFDRVLAAGLPQTIVSTQDFPRLVERTAAAIAAQQAKSQGVTQLRPSSLGPYVAPRNDVEITLVELWEQALGVAPIGIHDGFFELGGDSLIATMLVSQVCKTFQLDLSYQSFFNAPTVAASAETILAAIAQQADEASLAAALTEIERLTDEEVEALLAQP